jgi:hypothetical protein
VRADHWRITPFVRARPRLCLCLPLLPCPAHRFGSSSSLPSPPLAFAGASPRRSQETIIRRSVALGARLRSKPRRAPSSRSSLPPDSLNGTGATAFDLTSLYWNSECRGPSSAPAPCHPTAGSAAVPPLRGVGGMGRVMRLPECGISLDHVLGRLWGELQRSRASGGQSLTGHARNARG